MCLPHGITEPKCQVHAEHIPRIYMRHSNPISRAGLRLLLLCLLSASCMAPNLVGQQWKQATSHKKIEGIDLLFVAPDGFNGLSRAGNLYQLRYHKLIDDEHDWWLTLATGVSDLLSMTHDQKWVVGKHGGVWQTDFVAKKLVQRPTQTREDLNVAIYYSTIWAKDMLIAAGAKGTVVAQTPFDDTIRLFTEHKFPDFHDLREIDSKTLWAVGDSGSIVVSTDKGATWTEKSRRPDYRLNRIIMFDASTILLAAADKKTNTALVIRTNKALSVWEEQRFPGHTNVTNGVVRGYSDRGYLVGDNGLFVRTIDRAVTWKTCGVKTRISFTGVYSSDPWMGAVGRSPIDGRYRFIASSDTGKTWEVILDREDSLGAVIASRRIGRSQYCALQSGVVVDHQNFGDSQYGRIRTVPFVPQCCVWLNNSVGLIGGKDGMLARLDGYNGPSKMLTGIPDDFIEIDHNGGDSLIALASKGIYLSTDTGSSWSAMHPISSEEKYTRCRFVTRTDCIAVGMHSGLGVVRKSTNGGASWYTLLRHPAEVTGFTTTETGALIVCTADGKVLKSENDGVSWSTLLTATGERFRDITAARTESFLNLLKDGETILRSTDGGATWDTLFFPGEDFLHLSESGSFFYAWGNSMSAMKYFDGRCSFPFRQGNPDIRAISSKVTSRRAIALAPGGRILLIGYSDLTNNKIYPEWCANRVRSELWDICWINGGSAIVVGDSGVILRTMRNGSNWEVVHRNPGIGALSQVLPLSSGGALAAGDEVLLRSDSNGTTWTQLKGYPGQYIAMFDDRTWVAYAKAGNLYLTEDAGRNWGMTGVIPGTPREMVVSGDSKVFVLMCDTTLGRERYTVTRSGDFGATWHTLIETEDQIRRMRIFDQSRIFLLGTKGHVYIGDDYGRSWIETRSSLFKDFNDVAELYPYRYLFTGENRVLDILDMPAPVTTETVSLQAPSSAEIKAVFPNPARDFVLVSLETQAAGSVELSLYNSIGKAVWKKRSDARPGAENTQRIDIARLPPGVYFLRMAGPKTMDFRKLLIYR